MNQLERKKAARSQSVKVWKERALAVEAENDWLRELCGLAFLCLLGGKLPPNLLVDLDSAAIGLTRQEAAEYLREYGE